MGDWDFFIGWVFFGCRLDFIFYPIILFEEFIQKAAGYFNLKKEEIGNAYRRIRSERQESPAQCYLRPLVFVSPLCRKLNMSSFIEKDAMAIAESMVEKNLHQMKNPVGLAGGCIYISGIRTGERRGIGEIAEACYLSEGTIKKAIKKITINL